MATVFLRSSRGSVLTVFFKGRIEGGHFPPKCRVEGGDRLFNGQISRLAGVATVYLKVGS